MKVERHVFGSRTGYTTLAQSKGLAKADAKALERFSFGQTNDPGYLRSLQRLPAYISRPLGRSRRAITRVLPGQPDDSGRTTLLFVSAVLGNWDWIEVLRGDVLPLLQQAHLWKWDGTGTMTAGDVTVSGPGPLVLDPASGREAVGLLSEIERSAASQGSVVTQETQHSSAIIRAVEILIPDAVKPSFSCAARSLSAVDVRLNCLAKGVGIGSGAAPRVCYARADRPMMPYAAELVRRGLLNGNVPFDVVRSYTGFGRVAEPAAVEAPATPIPVADASRQTTASPARARTPLSMMAKIMLGFGLFILAGGSILGYGIYRKHAAQVTRDANAAEANRLCNMSERDFAKRDAAEREGLLGSAGRLRVAIEGDEKATSEAKMHAQKLPKWRQRMEGIHSQLKDYSHRIKELRGKLYELPLVSKSPSSPVEQLSTKRIGDLEEAADEARMMGSQKVAGVELSETAMKSDVEELAERAREVQRHIKGRQQRYDTFVGEMQDKLRPEVLMPNDIKEMDRRIRVWQGYVHNAPHKKKQLDGLLAALREKYMAAHLAPVREEMECLRTEMTAQKSKLASMQKDMKAQKSKLDSMQKDMKAQKLELAKTKKDLGSMQKTNAELRSELSDTRQALVATQRHIAKLLEDKKRPKGLTKALQNLKKTVDDALKRLPGRKQATRPAPKGAKEKKGPK